MWQSVRGFCQAVRVLVQQQASKQASKHASLDLALSRCPEPHLHPTIAANAHSNSRYASVRGAPADLPICRSCGHPSISTVHSRRWLSASSRSRFDYSMHGRLFALLRRSQCVHVNHSPNCRAALSRLPAVSNKQRDRSVRGLHISGHPRREQTTPQDTQACMLTMYSDRKAAQQMQLYRSVRNRTSPKIHKHCWLHSVTHFPNHGFQVFLIFIFELVHMCIIGCA
jgi:hypothetical protein